MKFSEKTSTAPIFFNLIKDVRAKKKCGERFFIDSRFFSPPALVLEFFCFSQPFLCMMQAFFFTARVGMSVPCESTAHSHDCSCHDCTAYSHDSPQTPRLRSITTILLNLQFYISGCIYNCRCHRTQTFPWRGLTCSQSFWRPPWRQTPNRPRSRDCSRDAAIPR